MATGVAIVIFRKRRKLASAAGVNSTGSLNARLPAAGQPRPAPARAVKTKGLKETRVERGIRTVRVSLRLSLKRNPSLHLRPNPRWRP